MMDKEQLATLIRDAIPDAGVTLEGADCAFSAQVVSASFEGLSLVKKQQRVLAAVQPLLQDGRLHALSVKAYTPEEYSERLTPLEI